MWRVQERTHGDKPDFNHPEEMIDFLNKMMISGGRMTRGKKLNHTNTVSPPGLTTQATPAAPLPTTPPAPLPQILTNSTAARATLSPASVNPPNGNAWRVREKSKSDLSQTFSLTLMVICVLTGVSGILVAALCWYRLQKEVQLAQKMAYTAYKGSRQHTCQRSAPEASHYKWQYRDLKKQHQAQEGSRMRPCQQLSTDSEGDIEEFTMYECPGLAPAGEMEVHNPLFDPSRSKQ
ncbi:neural proliferation differentiation and control protein 1-like isoform X2 [Spea bombifrons]|uniref:neural proliferation differentiation and control protein 1-like isoform X2 n=1 Tax=Spea bombifrons TaxID=233779 RepID=UPI00234A4E92|nr:neural proliferation differentiation and control protein 1-like isoform X2 [Spea bombifrons]